MYLKRSYICRVKGIGDDIGDGVDLRTNSHNEYTLKLRLMNFDTHAAGDKDETGLHIIYFD
jgi:hypothetical protein